MGGTAGGILPCLAALTSQKSCQRHDLLTCQRQTVTCVMCRLYEELTKVNDEISDLEDRLSSLKDRANHLGKDYTKAKKESEAADKAVTVSTFASRPPLSFLCKSSDLTVCIIAVHFSSCHCLCCPRILILRVAPLSYSVHHSCTVCTLAFVLSLQGMFRVYRRR